MNGIVQDLRTIQNHFLFPLGILKKSTRVQAKKFDLSGGKIGWVLGSKLRLLSKKPRTLAIPDHLRPSTFDLRPPGSFRKKPRFCPALQAAVPEKEGSFTFTFKLRYKIVDIAPPLYTRGLDSQNRHGCQIPDSGLRLSAVVSYKKAIWDEPRLSARGCSSVDKMIRTVTWRFLK